MAEDLTSAKNLLKLAIDLQNLCENTDNKEINKNILSIKFKILFLIQEYGQISPSTLVEELKIAKSNIALFCKQLIIEQLIISKQDDFDHRIIYYCLTRKGEKYVCNYLNLLNKHICQTFEENKLKTLDKNVKSISDIFLKNRSKNKNA